LSGCIWYIDPEINREVNKMNEDIIARAGEIVASKTGGGNEGYCVLSLIDKKRNMV
jgi:hypothetical protein